MYQNEHDRVIKKYVLKSHHDYILSYLRTVAKTVNSKHATILLKYADLIAEHVVIIDEQNDFYVKHREIFDQHNKWIAEKDGFYKRIRVLEKQLNTLETSYANKNSNSFHIQSQPALQKKTFIKSYEEYLDFRQQALILFLYKVQKINSIELEKSTFEEKLEELSREEKNKEHELLTAKMKLSKLETHLLNEYEKARDDYETFEDFLNKYTDGKYKSLTDIVSNLEDKLKDFVSYSKKMRIRYKAAINDMNEKLKSLSNSPPPSRNFS